MATAPVRRVVIGVIDNGIAFAHKRFRNSGGTRIEHLWQQEFPKPGPGTKITRAQIIAELAAANGDEDQVYRRLGNLSYAADGYKPLARRRCTAPRCSICGRRGPGRRCSEPADHRS